MSFGAILGSAEIIDVELRSDFRRERLRLCKYSSALTISRHVWIKIEIKTRDYSQKFRTGSLLDGGERNESEPWPVISLWKSIPRLQRHDRNPDKVNQVFYQ